MISGEQSCNATPGSGEIRPLSGLSVLELHAVGPVPFAGHLLQSLGANVLRISPPTDPGLGLGVPLEFDVLNSDKRVLRLDLKTSSGLAAARQALNTADVLLEGFRPGVLERLGLAPAELLRDYPRLVVGRLSGWGRNGAQAGRAGHDINYLAVSGVLHAIGTVDDPVPPLNLVADFGGGAMHLLVGILALLVRRGVVGKGGVADTSILAGTLGLTVSLHGLLAARRWTLHRQCNLLDGGAPFYRCYRAADGKHVAVGALEPKFFRELLALLGLAPTVSWQDQYDRRAWVAMQQRFADVIAQRTRDEWALAALDRDACLSPVLDLREAALHPHHRDNGWFVDASGGPGRVVRFESAL